MADAPVPAQFFFDRNFGIRNHDLEKVLDAAMGKKADYADLFFEYRRNEGISLEEGMVKNCSQSTSNGVGVRVLAETKTGYAYTDDITIENLEDRRPHGAIHCPEPAGASAGAEWASSPARPMISTRSRRRSTTFRWTGKLRCFTRSISLPAPSTRG